MSNHSVVVTREELYQKVWAEPIVHVAKRLELSGRGLAKLCARHKIPVPPRGWWARKQHGKIVRRAPLKESDPATAPIVIHGTRQSASVPVEPVELDREARPEWRIVVSQDLPITHRIVKATGAEIRRRLKAGMPAHRPPTQSDVTSSPQVLHTSVSRLLLPRALRIWQALLDAFERRGYAVSFSANGDTLVSVLGEPFEIALLERRKQVFVQRTWGRRMELEPSGLLFLRVGGNYSNSGVFDRPSHPVEDRLNRFLSGLVRRAIGAQRERAAREDRERRWRIQDDRRRQQQQERESEVVRIRHLRAMAHQWYRDRRLAEFLVDVERRVNEQTDEDRKRSAASRLEWARAHLQRRDPVTMFIEAEWPSASLPPARERPWSWE
jgi:hypothetical protein